MSYYDECCAYIAKNQKDEYTIEDVCEVLDARFQTQHRGRIYKLLKGCVHEKNILSSKDGRRGPGGQCAISLTAAGMLQGCSAYRKVNADHNIGVLYGFRCKYAPNIIKIGRTSNWIKRKRGYSGANTPGEIFLMEASENLVRDEHRLREFLLENDDICVLGEDSGHEFLFTTLEPKDLTVICAAALES